MRWFRLRTISVVIPLNVRKKIGVKVGDLLEASVERGRITFTPKSVVDRELIESLMDFKEGRAYGPFPVAPNWSSRYIKKRRNCIRRGLAARPRVHDARYSQKFLRQYASAPTEVQKAFDKQIGFLLENLSHPSLRAKKYDEALGLWQARVNRNWRFISPLKTTSTVSTHLPHPK